MDWKAAKATLVVAPYPVPDATCATRSYAPLGSTAVVKLKVAPFPNVCTSVKCPSKSCSLLTLEKRTRSSGTISSIFRFNAPSCVAAEAMAVAKSAVLSSALASVNTSEIMSSSVRSKSVGTALILATNFSTTAAETPAASSFDDESIVETPTSIKFETWLLTDLNFKAIDASSAVAAFSALEIGSKVKMSIESSMSNADLIKSCVIPSSVRRVDSGEITAESAGALNSVVTRRPVEVSMVFSVVEAISMPPPLT